MVDLPRMSAVLNFQEKIALAAKLTALGSDQ